MTSITVSATVNAAPATVYTIIADYRAHHPHILPKQYFAGLEVEEGGYGAGTRIRVHMNVLGNKRTLHMVVSEPEPGRVLLETEQKTGVQTTFAVAPGAQPNQSHVTFTTVLMRQPGLSGWIEHLITPPMMRRLFRAELAQLDAYAQQQPGAP